MASQRSSAGDPAKTLELLWRQPGAGGPQRGPKPMLTVDAIVTAAISLADEEGLEAVSMRSLAKHCAVAPMALYTYVPGKAELIDLMLDATYATMERRAPRDTTWRARLEAVAHDNAALYELHPWVASIPTSRPPLGPGLMAKYEYELRALEGTGLGDVEMDAALAFVLGFVESCARAAADTRAAQLESKLSDTEWWSQNAPLLARVFDAAKYPLAARVGTAAGAAHGAASSPAHAYAFGLERVLDGLSVLVERKEPPGHP
jgi:AcrR family transcriptional regulator